MATVTKRYRDGNECGYRVRWVDLEGEPHSKSYPKGQKSLADAFANKVEVDKLTGNYIDINAGKQTFKDYVENEWLPNRPGRPNTKKLRRSHLDNHILPFFGKKQIGQLKPSHVRTFITSLTVEKDLAPRTVTNVFHRLSSILTTMGDDKIIADQLKRDLLRAGNDTLPEIPKKRIKVWSDEQVNLLLAATPDRYKGILVTAIGSGPRRGEILGLCVDRVDFLRKTITYEVQLEGRKLVPLKNSDSKTHSAERTVEVEDYVITALSEHIRLFGTGPGGIIFTTPYGNPISDTTWDEIWGKVRKNSGVAGTLHDARHFYASLLIRKGIDPKTVAEMIGDTVEVVLGTYVHLWDDARERVRKAITEAMAEVFGDKVEEAQEAQ